MFKLNATPAVLSLLAVVSTTPTARSFSPNFTSSLQLQGDLGSLSVLENQQKLPPQKTAVKYFEVMYDVPLIPQRTGLSCWAAGAAMLVAWRDRVSFAPSEVARATGYWRQYREGLQAEDTHIFPIFGMVNQPAQTFTVAGFKHLLETYGPLWVASAEPGSHIRVVRGIRGDGTPEGTYVYLNDPWQRGMKKFRPSNRGSQYSETYAEFVRKQEALALKEMNVQGIYVAHLR